MEKTKKQYKKPEMKVLDVKLEPILTGSGYSPSRGNNGWFD